MSQRHCIFTESFAIFFSNAGKLETCQNANLTNSKRPSFGDDINVTFLL